MLERCVVDDQEEGFCCFQRATLPKPNESKALDQKDFKVPFFFFVSIIYTSQELQFLQLHLLTISNYYCYKGLLYDMKSHYIFTKITKSSLFSPLNCCSTWCYLNFIRIAHLLLISTYLCLYYLVLGCNSFLPFLQNNIIFKVEA